MQVDIGQFTLVLVLAYLIGSISFALVIGVVFCSIDPRDHGSHSLGATNVLRAIGWKTALVVFLLDASKGFFTQYLARSFARGSTMLPLLEVMLVAIVGHMVPLYLKPHKGGKGIAVGAGSLLYMTPKVVLVLLVIFVIVVGIWRYVSLGSIIISAIFPFLILLTHFGDWWAFSVAAMMGALVIHGHLDNIKLLMKGKERKLGEKAT